MKREELTAYDCNEGSYDSMGFPWEYKEMVYDKNKADSVMDSMERRIARLTKCVEMWKKVNEDLQSKNTRLRKAISLNSLKEIEYMSAENADLKKKVKELEEVISKMETTTPKWISVKDRLPEEEKPYLIYVKGHQGAGDEQMIVYWDASRRDFCVGEEGWPIDDEYSEVTHWMPLPPPTTKEI